MANDIHHDKQVPMMLTVMEASTRRILRNLVQPNKPKDKTNQIVETSWNHFEPNPSSIAEQF